MTSTTQNNGEVKEVAKNAKTSNKNNTTVTPDPAAAAATPGASASVPAAAPAAPKAALVATPAAPAAAPKAKLPAAVIMLSKLPQTKGNAKNAAGRGANGTKPAYYAVFGIPYGDWHTGKMVANGLLENIFIEGAEPTAENRVFAVYQMITVGVEGQAGYIEAGTEITRYMGMGEAKAFVPTTSTMITPLYKTLEIDDVAHFRRNGALAEHFTKQAAELLLTNPTLSAEYTATATRLAALPDYGGYVCCLEPNINTVVENVRNFYQLNPDTAQKGFSEILNWYPVYGQSNMPTILNEALQESIDAAEAAKTPAAPAAPAAANA